MSAKVIPITRAVRPAAPTPEQYLQEAGIASLPQDAPESLVRSAARQLAAMLEGATYSVWMRVRHAAIDRGVPATILDEALGAPPEPPQPLVRARPPAEEFPLQVLGPVLGPAAEAIARTTGAPAAMAGQSVLATATLAVQAHADIVLPFGQARPLSNFFLTIGISGERKSAVDELALAPVRVQEEALRQHYAKAQARWLNAMEVWQGERQRIKKSKEYENTDARRQALDALGPAPAEPPTPMLTCPEPTFEGLARLLAHGEPSIGVYSAEGGQFVGGHAMSADHKLKTGAGLSTLWDASPIRRIRAGDGTIFVVGRRVAMHLMVQPGVCEALLADPVLTDQGFLSRMLVVWPDTLQGNRMWRDGTADDGDIIDAYHNRLREIMEEELPLAPGTQNELRPRRLLLSDDARLLWISFANEVEAKLGPDGEYAPIRGLANKLPEHAARIAGTLKLVDKLSAFQVDAEQLQAAIVLARYYATEALRLFDGGKTDPTLRAAEVLLRWLQTGWHGPSVSLPDIYQRGPNAIRDKATAKRLVRVLEDHGWLLYMGPGVVDGHRRRETWLIQQP